MTISQAVNEVDALMHNTYTEKEKVAWLSRLDSLICGSILRPHRMEVPGFAGYDENTDTETVLLAPEPFDEMYPRWLECQIHYANGEYGRYNNAMAMWRTLYGGYENYVNRMNMVPGKQMFRW